METSSGGGPAALVAAGAPQLTWQWPLDPSDGETNRGSLTATGECLARPWAGEASRGGTTALARCPPRPSAVGSPPQRSALRASWPARPVAATLPWSPGACQGPDLRCGGADLDDWVTCHRGITTRAACTAERGYGGVRRRTEQRLMDRGMQQRCNSEDVTPVGGVTGDATKGDATTCSLEINQRNKTTTVRGGDSVERTAKGIE